MASVHAIVPISSNVASKIQGESLNDDCLQMSWLNLHDAVISSAWDLQYVGSPVRDHFHLRQKLHFYF